jgi:hypothetical protein
MHEQEAAKKLAELVSVTREDIARGKRYVLSSGGGKTDELADSWLQGQRLTIPRKIDGDAPNLQDVMANVARAISLRLALYQGVWELIGAGELFPGESFSRWQPVMDYSFQRNHGGLRPNMSCFFPARVELPPLRDEAATDVDVLLQGINCTTLHGGIREAIEQALICFRRGLYMPATAMLAAAAEATWTECGGAVAAKLADASLDAVVNDPYASIGKKVTEVRKTLEQGAGKALVKCAGQTVPKVNDAELWTTALRERRNALHWTKAKSFVVDHSETGTLLMAAPMHIGTLEAIRAAC